MGMPARPRGRSARPHARARPPRCRCPVPAAAPPPRRRWLGAAGSRSSHPGDGGARSLTPAPAAPRRTPASPWRAARPPPRPLPPRPPRASHGLRCAPAIGGRPAAHPHGPRSAGGRRVGLRGPPAWLGLTRGRRRVKRAPAASRLLNPLGAAACSPFPPQSPIARAQPADPPRSGADEPLLHWHFFGAGGRGTLGSRGGP